MKLMVAHKFGALVVTAMTGITLLTILSIHSMARVYDAANYATVNSLPSVLVLTDAFDAESRLSADIWNHLAQSDPARLAEIEKRMTDDRRAVDVALKKYEPLLSDEQDRTLLAADRSAIVAYDSVKARVLDLSRAGKKAEGRELWVGNQSVNDDIVRRLDAHRQYNLELATQGSEEGVRVRSSALRAAIGLACLTLLLIAAIGFAIARSIMRPLQQAVHVLSAIGQGKLDSQVIVTSSDEAGQMLEALDAMQRKIKERTDQEHAVANENGRIKCALDRASASVMLADENFNIIYSNEAARQLFRANQADFRRDLPNFDAERIVGSNIDIFHKNPAHQRRMLAGLQGTHTAEIRLGGHAMRIAASPVSGSDGKRTGIVVEWWDRTQEVRSEEEVSSIVKGALEGDLSKRISSQGKSGFYSVLAQSLNQLLENMAQIIERIKSASSEVLRGADEISAGNANLSQRTEEQSASLEETASSMEQMTSTVKQNADNAGQANQLAAAAREQAEKGGTVVASAIGAMASINEASKKIADIIGVIDEIAFQTNLLALNAAVEAARAGEQGRGFAVVASEVRSLAGRSATAAKEIKELIEDSVLKVDDGSRLVTQSGQTLEHIITSVKKVSDIVAEIAAASREQSTGIEQVSRAVAQMDEATQQNAALVEQATAASRSVADQARELSEIIDKYRIDGSSDLAGTAMAPGAPEVSAANGSASPPRVERRSATRPWSGVGRESRPANQANARS